MIIYKFLVHTKIVHFLKFCAAQEDFQLLQLLNFKTNQKRGVRSKLEIFPIANS